MEEALPVNLGVGAVAEWLLLRELAPAQVVTLRFFGRERDGSKRRALVRTVAERLAFG